VRVPCDAILVCLVKERIEDDREPPRRGIKEKGNVEARARELQRKALRDEYIISPGGSKHHWEYCSVYPPPPR
jgi:hypothetical protein